MLPSFSRPRLLIVGCGDVGLRVVRLLRGRWRLFALTSTPDRSTLLRDNGATPVVGDLDAPVSLRRLAGLADHVLHLAPPPSHGTTDPRTAALLRALARGGVVRRIVYASTTGVYGDCGGAQVDETRPLAPATDRAKRRVDAETRLRRYGAWHDAAVTILRVPGIYALDREGGNPLERVARGAPVLRAEDDVHTNHIHADDLARACAAALVLGRPQRVVNVSDDGDLKTGDHYDLVADLAGLPRPPRLGRDEALATMSPMAMSFLSESRRLVATRMQRELRLRLHYRDVRDAMAQARPAETD